MANHAQTIEARATFITLMLREDHQKVRQLFEQFDKTTMTKKPEIVGKLLQSWKSIPGSRRNSFTLPGGNMFTSRVWI